MNKIISICTGDSVEKVSISDIRKSILIISGGDNVFGLDNGIYFLRTEGNKAFVEFSGERKQYYVIGNSSFIINKEEFIGLDEHHHLLECKDGVCKFIYRDKIKNGYYKVSWSNTDGYIRCKDGDCEPYEVIDVKVGDGCNAIKKADESDIPSDTINTGDIIKDDGKYKLCLDKNGGQFSSVDLALKSWAQIKNGSKFGKSSEDDYTYMIDIEENNAILYYPEYPNTYFFQDDKLLRCSMSDQKCGNISEGDRKVGFYKNVGSSNNIDAYIECYPLTGGIIQCEKITPTELTGGCNKANKGKVINHNGQYEFCYDENSTDGKVLKQDANFVSSAIKNENNNLDFFTIERAGNIFINRDFYGAGYYLYVIKIKDGLYEPVKKENENICINGSPVGSEISNFKVLFFNTYDFCYQELEIL